MPIRREFAPRTIEADDLAQGRVEPHYLKVLARLLAAHAMAEKLTALGYERALTIVASHELTAMIKKNMVEERKHARLIYRILAELGISETQSDRSMISAIKAPSFEA